MGAAIGWGALAASSLVIGALLGVARDWPRPLVGVVLAFGAGALISAVSFELAEEGVRVAGRWPVAVGLAAGALTYFGADWLLDRGAGSSSGVGLALGAFLDGIPEQAVLGIGIATGEGVGIGLLVAIFVSNLPESLGSAADMRAGGRSGRQIVLLWLAVAAVCTVATVAGWGVADVSGDTLQGIVNGFAAGALLVMLVDSMIPEAAKKAGRAAGLVTALGFAVAAGLSGLS